MKKINAPRTGLRRRLAHMLFASAGILTVPPDAPADASPQDNNDKSSPTDLDDDSDDAVEGTIEAVVDRCEPVVAAEQLRSMLQRIDAFEATRVASLAALSDSANVRRALAEALVTPFPLVGDDFVLEQLATDQDPDVRALAARASHARGPVQLQRVIAHHDVAWPELADSAVVGKLAPERS